MQAQAEIPGMERYSPLSAHWVDSRDFAVLLAVCDAGSIRRAAAGLGLSPAAVSKAVRQVEARLGGPIFERSTAGMMSTVAGRDLLEAARQALHQLDTARQCFQQRANMIEGQVRVGVGPMAAGVLASELLPEAARRWPGIRIHVECSIPATLMGGLKQGSSDIVICALEDQDVPAGFVGHRLQVLQSVVLAAPSHPLAGRPVLDWPDIAGFDLAGFGSNSRFLNWYRERVGVEARLPFIVTDIENLAQTVLRSDLLLFVSRRMAQGLGSRYGLIQLPLPGPPFRHEVHCTAPREASPAVAAIAALIRETMLLIEE
ncbi:LysR family transcriptional regulator [Thermaurantiacus tibetensis]|uniref:LysR family transcriptional regulator n=1 Tax=Thermaurantiacus tibetensis TaxID=2759035 RepID=UPI00189043E3|nr:LysR family transcriptional regulator [Thermaurantiacus tibetensis]